MIKEKEVIKWLRECSDEGSGESCCECPYAKYDDCAGKLMQDAAIIMAVKEGGHESNH